MSEHYCETKPTYPCCDVAQATQTRPNGVALRQAAQRFSEDNPGQLVIGFNCLGFPMVQLSDPGSITASDVRITDLGGYWLDGKFQLFSATELELAEKDKDDDDF